MMATYPLKRVARQHVNADHHRRMRIASHALSIALPSPPDSPGWTKPGDTWPMFLNDSLSCCAESAAALISLHLSRVAQGAPIIWPDAAVEKLYEDCAGYVPGKPATDVGTVMPVLNERMTALGMSIGLQAPEVWTRTFPIDHTDITTIRRAIALFGAVNLGWNVTQSMMNNVDSGIFDNTTPGAPSIGGHDAIGADYVMRSGVLCLKVPTWTRLLTVSEATVLSQVEEAYIVVSRQHWLRANGQTPVGETFMQALQIAESMAAPE